MQEDLIYALLIIPSASVAFTRAVQMWKQKVIPTRWEEIQLKPFDCAFCLSFWVNAIYYHNGSIFEMILIWFSSMIVAAFIDTRL